MAYLSYEHGGVEPVGSVRPPRGDFGRNTKTSPYMSPMRKDRPKQMT